ncbi:transcription factor EMB1444-like [Rutidosis leptorrhynchoides]|uniref:transcription factor EMB1444-like n=1 Tax=Rutidosis leptorrhynchoides TaxID=125765 RepID=UPI003A99B8C6
MGGGGLHHQLKNLCVNTDWKYAVFWKLGNQSQMVMTWEDGYYRDDKEKNNRLESNWFDNMNEHAKEDQYTQDHLALAVANMSNRVYSIGEGIVGKVAATGKHLWISEDQLDNSSCSFNENFNEWKTQFATGIRNLVVVAIVPYGVVQLGSSYTIAEDLTLVNFIKEVFYELQRSSMTSTDCSPYLESYHTIDLQTDLSTSSGPARVPKDVNNKKLVAETKINESYEFRGGCELYESLGPAFYKQKKSSEWKTMVAETQTVTETFEETSSSCLLTQRSGSENILEAVVASACCSDSDGKKSTSFGQPVKVGKKRARAGQSCRPRPRDRQLIQDRIKELRQLVPNGSKCSIDALLERTIEHMLFMQRMMKHADKLDKCAEFKLRPFSREQGSSWIMEVGSDLNVCPIIVENIGIDGQMSVEMMSNECVHILEITEFIRSLGLTILRSATDAYGDKIWMRFVVEGENNIKLHRMNVLWSLLQKMELKTKT